MIISAIVLLGAMSFSASYKCKDAQGNWSEQSCPDYAARQQRAANEAAAEAKRHQPPRIGMSAEEALALDWPWGKPKDVNRTVTSHGVREQWVYGYGYTHRYLYFQDGLLTSIQD